MVRPVGGSSPQRVNSQTSIEQTQSTPPQRETTTPQTQTPVVGYDSDGQTARRAEHSISGRARAAQLLSETSSGTPHTSGSQSGNGGAPGAPDVSNTRTTQSPVLAGSPRRDRTALENDPNFQTLNSDTQSRVRDLMNQYSPQEPRERDTPQNRASRTNLMNLTTDENFAQLSPEGQRQALDRFTANPADPDNSRSIRETVADRAHLEHNQNFRNLNADTRQQVLTQLESYHRNSAARTHLINLATEPNFVQLSRSNQLHTLRALDRRPEDPVHAGALRLITRSDNFQTMNDANRSRILDMAANNTRDPDYLYQLARLTTDSNFGRLSTRNQDMALNVFENTTPNGRQALRNLLEREINGQPALTSRGYGNTGTLLEQLNRASTTPLDSRLTDRQGNPIARSQVTAQLLQEVNNPNWYINQDNRGTCSVTSDIHSLAAHNPAEYARLVTDLSTTGQSTLANGDQISVPGMDAWQSDRSNRSHGERLLQSALMSYGHPGIYLNWNPGPDGTYATNDDGFPNSPDGFLDENDSGLSSEEHARVLSGLHGRDYESYTGSANFQSDQTDMVNRTRQELRAGSGPVHVSLQWGGGLHAVEVTEIRDGRVYFRNPWGGGGVGATGTINGDVTNSNGPLRVVESSGGAIESMTIQDFEQYVQTVYVSEE